MTSPKYNKITWDRLWTSEDVTYGVCVRMWGCISPGNKFLARQFSPVKIRFSTGGVSMWLVDIYWYCSRITSIVPVEWSGCKQCVWMCLSIVLVSTVVIWISSRRKLNRLVGFEQIEKLVRCTIKRVRKYKRLLRCVVVRYVCKYERVFLVGSLTQTMSKHKCTKYTETVSLAWQTRTETRRSWNTVHEVSDYNYWHKTKIALCELLKKQSRRWYSVYTTYVYVLNSWYP